MSILKIDDFGIPESDLKRLGFKKIRWGSPYAGTDEGRTVWERIDGEGIDCCVFWYFPNEFDGYVNSRSSWLSGGTYNMRNHMIAQLQRRKWEDQYTDKVYEVYHPIDMFAALEECNNLINKKL